MNGTAMETTVELVATHLREQLQRSDGPLYVKSRFMAEEIERSAREIGAAMSRLADRDGDLSVERWAKSGGGVTWRVSRAASADPDTGF
jgi:hypothetical protein